MPTERMKELIPQLRLCAPATDAAIADVLEVTGADFPADLLDFLRVSNGAFRDSPYFFLNPIEEWPADTLSHEAPRNVWMIASDGSDGAYCWDQRGKAKQFVHAPVDSFKVWTKMGSTFEEFLEALMAQAKVAPDPQAEGQQQRREVSGTGTGAPAAIAPPAPKRSDVLPALHEAIANLARAPGTPVGLAEAAPPLTAAAGKAPAFLKKPAGIVMRLRGSDVPPWGRVALSSDLRLAAMAALILGDVHGPLKLMVRDLAVNKVVHERTFPQWLKTLQWAPDGRRLFALTQQALADNHTETTVTDALTGQILVRCDHLSETGVYVLPEPAWPAHPMGLLALIGYGEIAPQNFQRFLTVRDAASGAVVLHAPSGQGGVWMSANGRRLVLGYGAEGFAESYDLESGRKLAACGETVAGHVGALSINPEGTFMATGGGGWSGLPSVKVYELSSGELVHEFASLKARVPLAVAFVAEDRLVATTKGGTLHVLSVKEKKEVERFEFVKRGCYGHLSVAGDYVLAGTSESKTMSIYRL